MIIDNHVYQLLRGMEKVGRVETRTFDIYIPRRRLDSTISMQKSPQKDQKIYKLSIYVEGFIAPNMRSRRSSTVQLISLVDSEEDAEWPGPRLGRLGKKLKDPESAP